MKHTLKRAHEKLAFLLDNPHTPVVDEIFDTLKSIPCYDTWNGEVVNLREKVNAQRIATKNRLNHMRVDLEVVSQELERVMDSFRYDIKWVGYEDALNKRQRTEEGVERAESGFLRCEAALLQLRLLSESKEKESLLIEQTTLECDAFGRCLARIDERLDLDFASIGWKAPLKLEELTRYDLHEAIREAKSGGMGDFSGGWQILAIDKDGERVNGEPVAYQERRNLPSLKMIRQLADDYKGQAVQLIVEGMGMALADWGNAAEQRENAEPTGDWWEVTISTAA